MSVTGSRVVLAHPTGNQFFRHLARALRDAERLAEICTCIDWREGAIARAVLPRVIAAELRRRSFSTELGVRVAQNPWREVARLAASRLGLATLTRHETGVVSVDSVYRDFDRWVGRRLERVPGASMVYAYEDAAAATFAAAARLGWKRIYDLPIAYWRTSRRLLDEEAERYPAWEPTLLGTRDSAEKLARKESELMQADVVVCPSRFVAESLPRELDATKQVAVVPFGSPVSPAAANADSRKRAGRLRVLFAGSMSQRKGLADLFAAMRLLKRADIELIVMGSPVVEMEFYRREWPGFVYEPARPHAEVLKLMRTCDVICLPSIVEGRALVVQEAMSQGLPAIITTHTGAADVVEEERSGFVVPIRNPAALAEKLTWCAERREALNEMGRAAQMAAARHSWANYGAGILKAMERVSFASKPMVESPPMGIL